MGRYSSITDRPQEFEIDGGHPLAKGLVSAGLGRHAQKTHYYNSCADFYRGSPHGTLTAMAVPATATSGWAWNNTLGRWVCTFNGTNDYVLLGNFHVAPLVSYSAWIYDSSVGNDGSFYRAIVGKRNDSLSNKTEFAFDRNAGNTGGVDDLRFYINTAGNWRIWTTSGFGHVQGVLEHICVTYDAASTPKFYLNGKLFTGTVIDTLGSGTPAIPSNTEPIKIGNTIVAAIDKTWLGLQADEMFYNRILSASEISALADPSNVMLNGLILPPRRVLFAAGAAPAAGVKWWTLQSRSRVVGAGVQ